MRKAPFAIALALIAGSVPFFAHAAQIYLDPATGKYPPGVTFAVDVRINVTGGQCINAAEVDLAYPKDQLQAVAASDGDSIFSVWVKEPTIYNEYGLVSFVGGLPGGYCGRVAGDPSLSNHLATIYFRFPTSTSMNSSTIPQASQLVLLPGTRAVLNDGNGTIAPLTTAGAKYTPILSGKYAPLDTWAQALQNDTTPPEQFTVGVYRDTSLFDGKWFAAFSTVDKQTGIDHYDVAEVPRSQRSSPQNQWNWKRAVSPYLIGDQTLTQTIAVRAVDAAGNTQVAMYTPTSTPTKPLSGPGSWMPYIAVIGIIGLGLLQFFLRIF